MKRYILFFLLWGMHSVIGRSITPVDMFNTQTSPVTKAKTTKREAKIRFRFDQEPLSNILNRFAAKKHINIVLPQGKDALKETITFRHEKKQIPLSEAEYYINLFLGMAGYRIYPENNFLTVSKKSDNNTSREPFNLYIDVTPDNLPQTDQTIKAIYYLSNMRVPENPQSNDPINLIIKDILGNKKGFMFDHESNAIILIGPANNISSLMRILLELDKTGSPEIIEAVPLYNSSASTIVKILKDQLLATTSQPGRNASAANSTLYFGADTRVIADPNHNKLLLLGKEAAINRIREFVKKYLDAPTDSGKSIIHVHDVQYLDAKKFASTLQKVVQQSQTGQSKKTTDGPYRFFDNITIVAEEVKESQSKTAGSQTSSGTVSIGGNRLIIACTNSDWAILKPLIERLDKPEFQIILEIMIVDLTVQSNKSLQAQTRNPKWLKLHEDSNSQVEFQTAHALGGTIMNDNNTLLASDLLRILDSNPTQSAARSATSNTNLGSMLISFNDSCGEGIWGILKVLDSWSKQKILSHPFIVTKNNVTTRQARVEKKRAAGDRASGKDTSVTTIKQEDFDAELSIEVTPRASSQHRLNLDVSVKIEDFIPNTNFARTTRDVRTNTNMSSGQVLVLGGLTKDNESNSHTAWPLLHKIPVIGNLFKGTSHSNEKSNLLIFIHPTIVEPKLESGLNKHTDEKIQEGYIQAEDASKLFANAKDPITRLFFEQMHRQEDALATYLEETHYNYEREHSTDVTQEDEDDLRTLFADEKNPFASEAA